MGSFSHSFAGSEISVAGSELSVARKWFGSFSHSLAGSEGAFFLSLSLHSFSRSLCVGLCFGLSLHSFSHSLSVLRDLEMN